MKDVAMAFELTMQDKNESLLKYGFVILRITEVAKNMHRHIYKYQDEIVRNIQQWYDSLPQMKIGHDMRKKIYVNGKCYALTSSSSMRNFYGHFSAMKIGSLVCVQKVK